MDKEKVYLEVPKFTGENVPVNVAARIMKKDPQFIRQGLILGFLTFGVAFKKRRKLSVRLLHITDEILAGNRICL